MKSLKQIFNFINHHPLAGKHKIKAYCRFFYWQLSQLLFPKERVVKFIGNTKLVVKKGLAGATGNIYAGLHDFADMGFLLHFLRKDDLFFDIGANIGSYTILASGYTGARSVSFEPVASTYDWLIKNISVNHLNDLVYAINKGVGSSTGILHFTKYFDSVNHVVINPENNENLIEVQIVDFDGIAANVGMPYLVKIDVEGFETEVLNGMVHSLQSEDLKAIIIELNGSGGRYGFDEKLIHEKLLDNKFLPYQYDPFQRKLTPIIYFGSFNTIYIK